ncbi:MAG TPA: shikimate dehydrogenase [Solirubrobacteraceae bacterium]
MTATGAASARTAGTTARRLGVLGWPVAHSRSPAMHNAALAELGMTGWRYQALAVPPELFAETARALGDSSFAGANVTIPHKRAALAISDTTSDAARAIGAANTLTFADGTIASENTDAPGLIAAIDAELAGRRALVLGAGGSARASIWALQEAGAADVAVWSRTPERARALAGELQARAVAAPEPSDVLVNCTPVGLYGEADELAQLALTRERIGDYPLVVDLAYRDSSTALVDAARAAGARAIDGIDVLVAQGALSFQLWTGRDAPIETMREAARAFETAATPPAPRR